MVIDFERTAARQQSMTWELQRMEPPCLPRYARTLLSQEGPHIQLLGNQAPKYHTIEGIMGPTSLMVVYVDPLVSLLDDCQK